MGMVFGRLIEGTVHYSLILNQCPTGTSKAVESRVSRGKLRTDRHVFVGGDEGQGPSNRAVMLLRGFFQKLLLEK